MRKKLCLLLVLIFSMNLAFSYGYQVHNDQLLSTLYGLPGGWRSLKNYSDVTTLRYYVVTDAAYVAIDYNGITNSNKLLNIKKNLSQLDVDFDQINSIDYPSLGMGSHRAYNHQGFDYDYINAGVANAVKKQSRWNQGKNLMIQTAQKAYDFSDIQANIFAREQYYIHMLGDLQEGTARSIKTMGKTGSVSGLLDDFAQSLNDYAKSVKSIDSKNSRIIHQHADEILEISKKYSKLTDVTEDSRIAARTVMNNDLSDEIKKLNDSLDINVLPDIKLPKTKFNFSKTLGSNIGIAAIGTGLFTLYSAAVNGGFGNISLTEIATVGGISLVSATADSIITFGVPKLARFLKLGSGLTNGLFLGLNTLVDTALDSYWYISEYFKGNQTGWQSARNIGISAGKNILSAGVAMGVGTLLAHLPGAVAVGASTGPVGWIALAVSGVSLFSYFAFNTLAEQAIQYFDLRDFVTSVENGTADYTGLVDQYFNF